MSLWTGAPHQPAAGHAAAQFMDGMWRGQGGVAPGPAGGAAVLERPERAWRIWTGPARRQLVARFELFIYFRSCSRRRGQSTEARREEGREAAAAFRTPCQSESHLSLRPVTMATGCAQCTGEGGDGGAETMATQADGEGSLSLKKQEPLLICTLKLMTCVLSSATQQPLALFDQEKGGSALEKRKGSNRVAMTAHQVCLCPHYRTASGNSSCLLRNSSVLEDKVFLARMWLKTKTARPSL